MLFRHTLKALEERMRKQAEVIKPTARKPRRKELTVGESMERMKDVVEGRKQPLRMVKPKQELKTRSPRATMSREKSVERLNHIEDYMNEWIKPDARCETP
jgi:hypothetical protein